MRGDVRFACSRRAFLGGSAAAGAMIAAGLRPAAAQEFSLEAPAADLAAEGPFRWLDSGDQKAFFFKQFFAAYGKSRNIDAVYDGLPWNEIGQVLPLGIRNNSAQDVFCLPLNLPAAFAVQEGWVQPLDGLIPDLEQWKAGFPAGAFLEGLNVFGGKTYGLPYTSARVTSSHLLYNKKYMQDAGFDPATTPLDWDTFRAAAKKITENSSGSAFGYIIGGGQLNRWADVTRGLANMAGSACGDTSISHGVDFKTGEVIFDSDAFVGAVELLLAMNADGSIFPGVLSLTAPQARAFMPQGAAGMILQGPWNVPTWERENPDFDFGIGKTPAPANTKNTHVIVGNLASLANTMFVNAKAKNPKIAADVFHYLGTEKGQTEWGNIVGPSDPPIFPAAAAASKMSERSKATLAMFEDLIRIGPNPFARNPALAAVAKVYKEPTPSFAQTVQGLFAGQSSGVKAQLTAVTSATNKAIDAAFKAAKDGGAKVDRSDLVFANWDPGKDYLAADYRAL